MKKVIADVTVHRSWKIPTQVRASLYGDKFNGKIRVRWIGTGAYPFIMNNGNMDDFRISRWALLWFAVRCLFL